MSFAQLLGLNRSAFKDIITRYPWDAKVWMRAARLGGADIITSSYAFDLARHGARTRRRSCTAQQSQDLPPGPTALHDVPGSSGHGSPEPMRATEDPNSKKGIRRTLRGFKVGSPYQGRKSKTEASLNTLPFYANQDAVEEGWLPKPQASNGSVMSSMLGAPSKGDHGEGDSKPVNGDNSVDALRAEIAALRAGLQQLSGDLRTRRPEKAPEKQTVPFASFMA